MAHSPNDSQDELDRTSHAHQALDAMLRSGRSFSGRERNGCFLNTQASAKSQNRFANMSAISGFDFPDDGRAIALVDWDLDGDQDVWVSNRNAPRLRFLRNDLNPKGHFLCLKLVGTKPGTNRDAIGARIEVVVADSGSEPAAKSSSEPLNRTILKTLRAGEGFLAQSSKWLHFGLGEATRVEKIVVTWPSGQKNLVEEFGSVQSDRRYQIVQGTGRPLEIKSPNRELNLKPSEVKLPQPEASVRLPLLVRLPMLKATYDTLRGDDVTLNVGQGQSLLINLWSATCRPCIVELTEFTKRRDDLRASGVRVVALCIDHLYSEQVNEEASARVRATKVLSSMQFPFESGLATKSLVNYLQGLHSYHSPLNDEFPLPSSFLIDLRGRLAYIYKGKVSVDQVLADAKDQAESPSERFIRAAQFDGRTIQHPVVLKKMATHEAKMRLHLANGFQKMGQVKAAIDQCEQLLKIDPKSTVAVLHLASAYRQLGDLERAKQNYLRAIALDPKSAVAYNNLGVLALHSRHLGQAQHYYQKAIEIDPRYIDARMNLGVLYERTGKLVRAESEFREVLRLSPEYAKAEFHLGILASKKGRLNSAKSHFQKALLRDDSDADIHVNLGIVLARLGEIAQAGVSFERAIQLDPEFAEAHNNMGLLFESQGQLDKARSKFQDALRVDSQNLAAKSNLQHVDKLIARRRQKSRP